MSPFIIQAFPSVGSIFIFLSASDSFSAIPFSSNCKTSSISSSVIAERLSHSLVGKNPLCIISGKRDNTRIIIFILLYNPLTSSPSERRLAASPTSGSDIYINPMTISAASSSVIFNIFPLFSISSITSSSLNPAVLTKSPSSGAFTLNIF